MKAKTREKERHISKREMNMATDIFLRMAMLVLIEDFGFGTKAQKVKRQDFKNSLHLLKTKQSTWTARSVLKCLTE